MKKHISFFVAGILLTTFAHAQFSYGLKAGGARTFLPGGDYPSDPKAGFFAGISGSVQLKKSFYLQAELYYGTQGDKKMSVYVDDWDPATGAYTISSKAAKITYKLNYINLPVLLKYQHKSGLFAEAGAQAGWLVSAKLTTPRRTTSIKEAYRTFDFGWNVSAGYQLRNGLGINLRYNQGVINVYKKTIERNQYWTYIPHNNVIQLGLFYNWKKG